MNEWDGNYNYNSYNYAPGRPADRNAKKVILLVGSIFTLVGVVFLIVGLITLMNAKKKAAACTGEAKATVIEIDEAYHEDEDGHKSKVYAPIVEYTVGGETYTEMSPVHTSPCKFTVGQTVMVHYDPADPHVMIIEGDNGTKLLYTIFIIMGGFFALMGSVFVFLGLKNRRERF